MNWRFKGLTQQLLSYAPGGRALHYALQRRFGGLKNVEAECLERIDEWTGLMGRLYDFDFDIRGRTLIEIGTGYYPALPFCMYLAGAAQIHTLDMARHLRADLTLTCTELLARESDRIWKATRLTRPDYDERLRGLIKKVRQGADLTEATAGCIQYHAPTDARATSLPDACVDLSFSNNVLEHIEPHDIEAILREMLRILRPNGVLAHQVDAGDHYADIDSSIDKYHFLQFSDSHWRLWNNSFLYQNRLRAPEYATLAERCGFDAVSVSAEPIQPAERQALQRLKPAKRFAHFSIDELCTTHFLLKGRCPAEAEPTLLE